jgi:flagellar biosynthesis/type III secretory pathway protein FliH
VLFAEDFDAPPPSIWHDDAIEEPQLIAAPSASDIEAVRREALVAGRAQGHADAMARFDDRAASRAENSERMLRAISAALTESARETQRMAEDNAAAIARLLLGTLATMLPTLCANHGAAEVAAIAGRVVPSLTQTPRITIRINPHALEALDAALEPLDPDLRERIVVTATDAIAEGDIRISWADGAAWRDTRGLWRSVCEVLAPLGLLDPEMPCAGPRMGPAQ